ncbi:unnamed protein product [Oppiella nova]|uniref:Ankyrin repeat domain-containing protein 12 n=1 Tax=Oppiella nova TaxID=334625 RepID=A0A7R9LEV3_9ACAR|nr:unnamed protein product [Oppiella nova]CAG2162955.1 unnamed protein product [Oppiella nova]
MSADHTTNHTNYAIKSGQRVRRNPKGETALHVAAIKGDLTRVRQIIADNKYDIDITDFAGWSPIHEACNRGFVSIVEELLKAGSNVNARGYNNDTPLIDAAVNGHHLLVQLLLKYGADYTLTNNSNKTALQVTKSVRVYEEISSLIEEKMRKNGGYNKDNSSKSRSSSPNSSSPLKPTSPRLTLRFQTIKDPKQSTTITSTPITTSSTMSSTKSYSVSSASDKDKEVTNDSTSDRQTDNKTTGANGSPSDTVAASSDHNYTTVDSTQTSGSDESNRNRKRRKSNDGSVSSTSNASGGQSSRSGSTSSVGSSTQVTNNWHNKKHPHHHHLNHSNKSNNISNKDKKDKKLFGSSSDSEGIEGSECDKELNPKDTSLNPNTSVGSTETNAPKVPPLRIVLPANTSITTPSVSATTAASSGSHSSVSSSVTSSTAPSGAKFPYVVSSEESFQSEGECVSGAVGSQRITRSSQRVAQQQNRSTTSGDHHSDSEESGLHNTSQTDSQHPRKRKIRNNNTNENKSHSNNNNTNNSVNSNSNGDNDNDSSSSTSSLSHNPKDERHRYKLKVQHMIDRQKLILSAEQEILRVHGRAARAMVNQSIPFSVCSILKDEEIYNIFDNESEQNETISNHIKGEKVLVTGTSGGLSANRTRYNGRLFLSWLQDVADKWQKTKDVMLLRHKKESESMLAMQKLEWEWKLKEFGLCDLKTSPNIDDKHVPKVFVSEDFELFPV